MSHLPYPAYKDSGVAWLGEVPAHWTRKRLRFVAAFNPSKQEATKLPKQTEVSFLPMEAVGDDGSLDLSRTRPIADVESGYTYFAEGDITFAKITPCFENGKGAIMRGLVNGIGFGTTELTVLRPQACTDPAFLYHLLMSQPFRSLGEATMYGAGGQKRVPDDFVRNFDFAWPPYAEQVAIAAFLDRETARIDALIAKQERLIALLQEKRQALISHAVTKGLDRDAPMKDSGVAWLGKIPAHWQMKKLGHVSGEIQTGPFGSQLHAEEYVEDGIPVINPANIQSGKLKPDNSCTIDEPTFARLQRHALEFGDIVFGRRGEMGRCALVTEREAGWLCGTGCLNVRIDRGAVDPYFISIVLGTPRVKEWLKLQSVGSTMENLNTSILARIDVPVPPIAEQVAITAYIDSEAAKIEMLINKAHLAIDLLREHRTALISAAVTGKIDVRSAVLAEVVP